MFTANSHPSRNFRRRLGRYPATAMPSPMVQPSPRQPLSARQDALQQRPLEAKDFMQAALATQAVSDSVKALMDLASKYDEEPSPSQLQNSRPRGGRAASPTPQRPPAAPQQPQRPPAVPQQEEAWRRHREYKASPQRSTPRELSPGAAAFRDAARARQPSSVQPSLRGSPSVLPPPSSSAHSITASAATCTVASAVGGCRALDAAAAATTLVSRGDTLGLVVDGAAQRRRRVCHRRRRSRRPAASLLIARPAASLLVATRGEDPLGACKRSPRRP